MFRREIEGTVYSYQVAGLWGSGNTVIERELMWIGAGTTYNMWDGKGLTGPRTGEYIDKYPALWGTMPLTEFIARYDVPEVDCQVFSGKEELGIGCVDACLNMNAICPDNGQGDAMVQACRDDCPRWPRATSQCVEHLDDCQLLACTGPREDPPND